MALPARNSFEFVQNSLKWGVLASIIGGLAGIASALFLTALAWATDQRTQTPLLLFGLPVVGFGVGWLYHHYGANANKGNHWVIEQIHMNTERIPARMAGFVLVGTVLSHLFGASVGREGTAVQMGASLADSLRRLLGIRGENRRIMLMTGVSAGFSAVFGTPIAGLVFSLEFQSIGKIRYEGLFPCLIGALVGDGVVRALGVTHSHYPLMPVTGFDALLLLKVALAGSIFGLASAAFIEWTEWVKRQQARFVAYPPFRPMVGAIGLIIAVLVLQDTTYLGLSLPLIQTSLHAESLFIGAFALKIFFTGLSLGSGFMGGEVTPLFVIGATLGSALSPFLGIEAGFLAMIGFVAVFAGASNTPLACALMGIELFGGGGAIYLVVGCVVAYLVSGHRSIYHTQRLDVAKM